MTSPLPADVRLADASEAPQHAFVVHGQALALMGVVARLAAAGQLEALRALDYASFVFLQPTGTSWNPAFELVIESDEDAWTKLSPHAGEIASHLRDISGVIWSVRRSLPLSIEGYDGEPIELSRAGVATALANAGEAEAATLALRASGFHVRPRPGGGRHIVTVYDPEVLAEDEMSVVDDAIFRKLPARTSWTLSPGFGALARRLAPSPAEKRPAHVAVVTSSSDAMQADTYPHLNVFDLTTRIVRVSQPDAPVRLADTLAELRTVQPAVDAVLIARGGGNADEVGRLATSEVRAEVERLRGRDAFVVVAFGHGDFHVDLAADVHAKTPTSGAEIIRRKFHDAPEAQRLAYANHQARVDALAFDGGSAPMDAARSLVQQLGLIDEETATLIARHTQDEPIAPIV